MGKKLYIDCQFFQTPVWDRGMGKYTIALLNHAGSGLASHDVVLIFNKNLPKHQAMIKEVKDALPQASLLELDLATTDKSNYLDAAKHNKGILEQNIRDKEQTDTVFFIPCLFQEPTAPVYPNNTHRLMIYYDAIPFLYYQKYMQAINYDNYLQRYRTLLESDSILTISETVKDDLAIYLGIEDLKRKIISIDGAAIEGTSRERKTPGSKMPPEYILLTTSDDVRKNNRSAVRALEQLRKISKRNFKLVITSSFAKDHKAELEKLSSNLLFMGNVEVDELNWLYENAAAVLCTSEYEGLGLPILEAVRFNKPIACSNIAVFREISNKAFYFFDALDIEDITLQLYDAIQKKDWAKKSKLYPEINKKYTWKRSAELFLAELNAIYAGTSRHATPAKPKIAILCPTPGGYSAIGRVVQEIHDALASYFQIDYYFEDRKKNIVSIRPNYLAQVTDSYDVTEFNARRYSEYDAVVYHVGNSEYHFETIQKALYLPGIAIIHDTKLTECFGEMARLGYISPQRLEAEAGFNELTGTRASAFIGSILNNQIGAIVHSQYAEGALEEINLSMILVKRGALPLPAPKQRLQAVQRKAVHVGLAGVLSGTRKGTDIIKELAADPEIAGNVAFHVFGFSLLDPAEIKELKSYDNISVQTDLSDLAYQTQLANLDIMINFRSEYKGETSSSVLEAMRYGCVVMVNGSEGWFKELPDEAVAKVNNPAELELVLKQLILSPDKRHSISEAAKKYVPKDHSPAAYGQDLRELFDEVVKAQTGNAKRSAIIKSSKSLAQVASRLKEEPGDNNGR